VAGLMPRYSSQAGFLRSRLQAFRSSLDSRKGSPWRFPNTRSSGAVHIPSLRWALSASIILRSSGLVRRAFYVFGGWNRPSKTDSRTSSGGCAHSVAVVVDGHRQIDWTAEVTKHRLPETNFMRRPTSIVSGSTEPSSAVEPRNTTRRNFGDGCRRAPLNIRAWRGEGSARMRSTES
jgi:hypothetical protein